jgi:hypothetical protein
MNEYKKFLKHLGINSMLMKADMRSRLPDSEKPVLVRRCKEFEVCESVKQKGCKGCNVWNYLYDIKALQKWCKEHGKDFMQYTMVMHRMLKEKK